VTVTDQPKPDDAPEPPPAVGQLDAPAADAAAAAEPTPSSVAELSPGDRAATDDAADAAPDPSPATEAGPDAEGTVLRDLPAPTPPGEKPRVGPVIVAPENVGKPLAPPKPPLRSGPVPPARPPKPKVPRRKRPTAVERHRRVFFARLKEAREARAPDTTPGEQPAVEVDNDEVLDAIVEATTDDAGTGSGALKAGVDPAAAEDASPAEPAEPAAAEDASPATADPAAPDPADTADAAQANEAAIADTPEIATADAPASDAEAAAPQDDGDDAPAQGEPDATADASAAKPTPRPPRPPVVVDPLRLQAAIGRVGGEEAVREALAPKTDEKGERLKWAVVCADASQGLKPGEPAFTAWVRLAATPVGAIKDAVGMAKPGRGGGARGERPGRGRDEGRSSRPGGPPPGGGRGRGRDDRDPRDRGPRPGEGDTPRRVEDGRVSATIRFVGQESGDDERREREQRRKDQREAKRQAERDRLDRLGY